MAEPFIGEIKMFGGNFAPRQYALCNGQLLPISQNTALFSLLGTTYGGNGQTTFGLPDLRGRVPLHHGHGPGLSQRTLGETFGTETVTLNNAQMPMHNHAQQASTSPATSAAGPSGAPAAAATPLYGSDSPQVAMAAPAVSPSGGGQPHDNMAPYLTLNFIIALQGIFPSRN